MIDNKNRGGFIDRQRKGVVCVQANVTRGDSQRRFSAQHSVAMLEQCCDYSKQRRNNVATLCCAKNRYCKSSCVNLTIFFGNHVTVRPSDRPSASQAYQCKITQLTDVISQATRGVFGGISHGYSDFQREKNNF